MVLGLPLLTVFVRVMVHCRSEAGQVKHQQRGFKRGFARCPRLPTDMAYTEGAARWAHYDNTSSTLPPPPPLPVGVELKRQQTRSDWNELGDEESLETEVVTQTAAGQPSNADYLATINKALQIIELHCQKPRMISLDAMVPAPASVAPPSVPAPVTVG